MFMAYQLFAFVVDGIDTTLVGLQFIIKCLMLLGLSLKIGRILVRLISGNLQFLVDPGFRLIWFFLKLLQFTRLFQQCSLLIRLILNCFAPVQNFISSLINIIWGVMFKIKKFGCSFINVSYFVLLGSKWFAKSSYFLIKTSTASRESPTLSSDKIFSCLAIWLSAFWQSR